MMVVHVTGVIPPLVDFDPVGRVNLFGDAQVRPHQSR
jgi:hypothetical protein